MGIFKKNRKTIKKPCLLKRIASYACIFLAIYMVLLLVFHDQINWEIYEKMSSDANVYSTLEDLDFLARDGITEGEKELYIARTSRTYQMLGIPATIFYNGEPICDTQNKMMVMYDGFNPDSEESYLHFYCNWNSEANPEIDDLYKLSSEPSYAYIYQVDLEDGYFNPDDNTFYPGMVALYRYPNIGFSSAEKLIKEYDLTPKDTSVLEGYQHITFDEYSCAIDITGEITDNNKTLKYNDSVYCIFDTTMDNARVEKAWITVNQVAICIVLALGLFVGTISYFRAKSIYSIFTYRQKTTNAMAHDLKTPLAVMSLSVANLKENIGVDTDRVSHHADQIEDSINYTNGLINNILNLSKSEDYSRSIKKENVDVKEEINKHISSVKSIADSKNIKITVNAEDSIIKNTDKEIWNQSISNLIDNAVKYASSNSEILVKLDSKTLTITNQVDKDIDTSNLKEPFVKGDSSRGENSGSGLGLAIANNNLASLGYKLDISCKDKQFTATVQ